MCGRYTLTVTLEELMVRYMIEETTVPFHRPKYNVAPSQQVLAIINDGQSNRLGELKWGLIPPWADDPKIGFQMLNARSETAASKPAFQNPLRRKRCIIPADGFYEWKTTANGKQPMRIVLKSRALFSLAGLYESWISPEGSKINSCTILTTTPNELIAPIHDRMPVILRPEDEQLWLNRSVTEIDALSPLLRPYHADELDAYAVSPAVGSVRNDDCSLIDSYTTDEQLELW
ncbi:putative SOS response-associated peptidase YedK [Paenibacillus castaneae]|uniref:SOS response-associated peptidase n=1 Tax=Paenibacillus castaneae TaxID=474957 RepID=UPI000C9C29F1|nr:SOS response-associated peptidase [Paenibacillus castaneae]NIK75705.1 putative SOS response-associated peptidase YedK [Paenibacillus castaneae]